MFSIQTLFDLYNQFLNNFPEQFHGWISLGLAVLLVVGIYKVIKKQFIYLILLVILLPASIPILGNIWKQVVEIMKFLLSRG